MAKVSVDCLTDSLVEACLACDASSISAAIARGADINRANHLGILPVHIVVDPGNHDTDAQQAICLGLLLSHGVQIEHRHRNVYTVCERISTFLPQCALAVISHFGGLPEGYDDLEQSHQHWWDHVFGQWKSDKDSHTLLQETVPASADRGRSRL